MRIPNAAAYGIDPNAEYDADVPTFMLFTDPGKDSIHYMPPSENHVFHPQSERDAVQSLVFSKRVGRGTTILSYIDGDTEYIVSDGRVCSTTQDIFLVLKGDDRKIHKVTEKICATTAGNVALCDEMLEIARKTAENSENIYKMSTAIKKFKQKYLNDIKKDSRKSKNKQKGKLQFEAQFGLHSVDGNNGGPYIGLIGYADVEAFGNGGMVSSGTGGEAAEAHLKKLIKQRRPQTPHELLSYMKTSVVVSCLDGLNCRYSGGLIQEAILSPTSLVIEEENNHLIKHLADNHQQFIDMLKNKLLCITRKFAYEPENEKVMTTLIGELFLGVAKELLLGVHANLIVRCLHFPNEAIANNVFASLGKEHAEKVKLRSGVYQVEFKRPTQNELRKLATHFVVGDL